MHKTSLKQDKYLEQLKKIALQKGGKCLSCIYKNNITPLKWECKRGHRWGMKPSYIKDGSWCKECKKIELLDGMKKYAKSRGGTCLSGKFKNSKTKLIWKCNSGHIWKSNAAKYNQSWCPYCAKSVFISEAKCRFIFKKLTGCEFTTDRAVLNGLELDGYCEHLKMAFEFHGQQHFEFVKYFHKNIRNFVQRQKRDLRKIELCQVREISFLIVPYWENSSDRNLLSFIKSWLVSKNFLVLEWRDQYWNVFYKSFINILNNLQKLASRKNGKLLSIEYYGACEPLKWQCEYGHIWTKTPSGIQQGHWCPKCNAKSIAKRNRHPLLVVQNLAKENNTILISEEYKNNITPLEWECKSCNHKWLATLNCMKTRLLKGKWCLLCTRRKQWQ